MKTSRWVIFAFSTLIACPTLALAGSTFVTSGNAIIGESQSGNGVVGASHNGAGIRGLDLTPSANGFGVLGTSTEGVAVKGVTLNNNAIMGVIEKPANCCYGPQGPAAVLGTTGNLGGPIAVLGQSTYGYGVAGVSVYQDGVFGQTYGNANTNGVAGIARKGSGILAQSQSGTALRVNVGSGQAIAVYNKFGKLLMTLDN